MNRIRVYLSMVAVIVWVVSAVHPHASAQNEPSAISRLEALYNEVVLFADDLAQDEPGSAPTAWQASSAVEEHGELEVIIDPVVPMGKALRVKAKPHPDASPRMILRAPIWPDAAEDARKIGIQYALKWVEGSSGIYLYINKTGSDHRMILLPGGGNLVWHKTGASKNLGPLRDGWNQVRIIANIETQTADVYLNDMETPAGLGLPFQRPVNSWEEMRMMITHETHREETREVHYADFKIWVVE